MMANKTTQQKAMINGVRYVVDPVQPKPSKRFTFFTFVKLIASLAILAWMVSKF